MTITDLQMLLQNNIALLLIAAWSLPWKGWALWRAARLRDKWWFVAILILNTLAIADILYIFWISKRKSSQSRFEGVAPRPASPKTASRGGQARGIKTSYRLGDPAIAGESKAVSVERTRRRTNVKK